MQPSRRPGETPEAVAERSSACRRAGDSLVAVAVARRREFGARMRSPGVSRPRAGDGHSGGPALTTAETTLPAGAVEVIASFSHPKTKDRVARAEAVRHCEILRRVLRKVTETGDEIDLEGSIEVGSYLLDVR
jgi:hypothetical protein